jgi:hypothetical protein
VIRVTFADGATEDREDDSPCIGSMLDPALKHPSEERWYLWLDGDRWPLSFCGHSASPLSQWRGWGAWVWRITSAPNEPLAGQWAECHVESYPEQIDRLTAERDEEEQRADRWRADYDHKQEEWSSSCDILAADLATEKARADAAGKRLADLRVWADDIVKRSREEAPKHPGKANTTWTILSVLEWVVARIDGKEG